MRVGIATWGSEGDVRPFLVLAKALCARGHQVSVSYASVDDRDYRPHLQALQIDARPCGQRYFAGLAARESHATQRLLAEPNPLRQVTEINRLLFEPVVDEMYGEACSMAHNCDVMVGHFLHHPAATAARKANKPWISIATAPVLPSQSYAPIGAPDWGPLTRMLSWWLAGAALNRALLPSVNRLRLRVGLGRLRHTFGDALNEPQAVMVAVSPTLVPRPDDWPAHAKPCGFLHDPAWPTPLPVAVEAFVARGPAPAYLTFGSMMAMSPDAAKEATEIAVAAFKAARMRALVQTLPELAQRGSGSAEIMLVGALPHAAIFPHCSLIVHHGGAGTTQAATLAGRPSVVVAHVADQRFWGELLQRKGAAPALIRRPHLSVANLSQRVRTVYNDPRFTTAATLLGQSMRQEDGPATAIAMIEAVEAQRPSLMS